MPLDTPQTQTGDTTWTVNGHLNATSVTGFQVSISVEGPSTESEGDALLQALVDLLAPRYYNVSAFKGYNAYTTRTMTPS
ncbi:hypothetical protein [Streptomyces sp. NPDC050534]|uniref:hypothetical protein n=1 Tax=Streptomyces sp. NPDC050534 TaxID=3365625 RepID=UPI0037A221E4